MEKYQHNPRVWTAEQKRKLRDNLRELGDISGVVHDLNSDQIVGGNFRSEVFDINNCDIEIVTKYDEPNAQGTVALGFVVWEGNRYNYRQVRWTKEQCDKACITANSLGGDWDEVLLVNEWAEKPLSEWGVETISQTILTDGVDLTGLLSIDPIAKEGESRSGCEAITFTFKKEDAQVVKQFIKQTSKDVLTEKIVCLCQNVEAR